MNKLILMTLVLMSSSAMAEYRAYTLQDAQAKQAGYYQQPVQQSSYDMWQDNTERAQVQAYRAQIIEMQQQELLMQQRIMLQSRPQWQQD